VSTTELPADCLVFSDQHHFSGMLGREIERLCLYEMLQAACSAASTEQPVDTWVTAQQLAAVDMT
jgi:hypothetical protein